MTGFDEFWSLYPRKIAKGAARLSYARARKVASHEEIMEGLQRFVDAEPWDGNLKFCVYPERWLKYERWHDEYEQPERINGVRLSDMTYEQRRELKPNNVVRMK